MKVDITSCISELLYERELVVLPQLGGFVSSYKAAVIDHVQGSVQPPAKDLNFNENLMVNDGVLIDRVAARFELSPEEARQVIDEYVGRLKERLRNREIVQFAGIGRLYLDFENQYKFLQENTNFNTDSYGLPAIQFYPIVRNSPQVEKAVARKSGNRSKPPARKGDDRSRRLSQFLQRSMPWIVLLALLIILVSIYFIQRDFSLGLTGRDGDQRTMPVNRVNTKPSKDEETAEIVLEEEPEELPVDDGSDLDPNLPAPEPEPTPEDTEAPTIAPGQQEAVVIIGSFRDDGNAESIVESIYKAGYDAYTDQKGTATRVGVQFAYGSSEELDRMLRDIRKKFNPKAWVLRRE